MRTDHHYTNGKDGNLVMNLSKEGERKGMDIEVRQLYGIGEFDDKEEEFEGHGHTALKDDHGHAEELYDIHPYVQVMEGLPEEMNGEMIYSVFSLDYPDDSPKSNYSNTKTPTDNNNDKIKYETPGIDSDDIVYTNHGKQNKTTIAGLPGHDTAKWPYAKQLTGVEEVNGHTVLNPVPTKKVDMDRDCCLTILKDEIKKDDEMTIQDKCKKVEVEELYDLHPCHA